MGTIAKRPPSSTLLVLVLIGACAGQATEDTSTLPALTTGLVATTNSPTTEPPAATNTPTTTAPPEVDLINPVAGTLAGLLVGEGPVDPMLVALDDVLGPPQRDTGWGPNDCFGTLTHRYVSWEGLAAYLEEADGAQVLLGYQLEGGMAQGSSEEIELPEGIRLGMTHAEAEALYPEGSYTHDSLELDGVMFESPHFLAVVGPRSENGGARVNQVWVGVIPVCD